MQPNNMNMDRENIMRKQNANNHNSAIIKQLEQWVDRNNQQEKMQSTNMMASCRLDEFNFLCATEPPDSKLALLMYKNQYIEQLNACGQVKILDNGSEVDTTGGRYIAKAPEPIKGLAESPIIQEMRLMHIDFVEEAYWKRINALKLALECQRKITKTRKT